MGVASGCGEQEVGMASGSGWNLWVWLLGVDVRRYISLLFVHFLYGRDGIGQKNPKILFDCYLWPSSLPLYTVSCSAHYTIGMANPQYHSHPQVGLSRLCQIFCLKCYSIILR